MDLQSKIKNFLSGVGQTANNVQQAAIHNIGAPINQAITQQAIPFGQRLLSALGSQPLGPQGVGFTPANFTVGNTLAPIAHTVANAFTQAAPVVANQSNPLSQPLFGLNQLVARNTNLKDVGTLTKAAGYATGGTGLAGAGALGALLNPQKPLQGFSQGMDFGAQVGPIAGALGSTPGFGAVKQLFNRIPIGENAVAGMGRNVLGNVAQGTAKEAATGAMHALLNSGNPAQEALDFAKFGVVHGLNGKGGPEDLTQAAVNQHGQSTQPYAERITGLIDQAKNFLDKQQKAEYLSPLDHQQFGQTEQYLRGFANDYIGKQFSQKAPIADIVQELTNRVQVDSGIYDRVFKRGGAQGLVGGTPAQQPVIPQGGAIPLPPGGRGQPSMLDKLKGFKDQLITESRQVLGKQGPAGKEVASRIDRFYNDAERMTGGAVADFNHVTQGLKGPELERVLRSLDGQQVGLAPQEAQAVQALRGQLNTFASGAQQAGLEIRLPDGTAVPFAPRENYLPHIVDPKKLAANQEETVAHLVSSGQFPDAATAQAFVSDIVKGTPASEAFAKYFPEFGAKLHGNLEYARVLDFPQNVLRYDKQLLPDYFAGAARRIHEATNFGPQYQHVDTLLNQVAREGGDPTVVRDILDRNLGRNRENRTLTQGIGAVKQLEAATKLGLSAISNAGQSVNTATVGGVRNTITEMVKAMVPGSSKRSEDFALRTGAIVESALKDIQQEAVGTGKLSRITAPGFGFVEKFNRVVAANVGKKLAEKAGITDPAEVEKYAQNFVNKTQFKTRPIDLPPIWSSATGRIFTQFKSFSFKQGQFIRQEVIGQAAKGNLIPLTRYIALGLVAGEGIADAKAAVRRRDRPTNIVERGLDNLGSVGGFGLMQDAQNAAQRGPEAMLQFLTGPIVGDAAKLAGGVGLALQGKPKTLTRFGLGNIPIIGQPIANTVYPPKGPYKSRTPDIPMEIPGFQLTPDQKQSSLAPGVQEASLGGLDQLFQRVQAPDLLAAGINAQKVNGTLTPLDEQRVRDQISSIKKQEKAVTANSGVALPIIGQVGGLSEQQKNDQLTALLAQQKALQDALKAPAKPSTSVMNAQYSLASDSLKRSGDFSGWVRTTEQQIRDLASFQQGLNPTSQAAEVARLQNRMNDLATQVLTYQKQGGFTKAKGVGTKRKAIKGVRFATLGKSPKIGRTRTLTLKGPSSAGKLPTLKTPKIPKLAYKTPKALR